MANDLIGLLLSAQISDKSVANIQEQIKKISDSTKNNPIKIDVKINEDALKQIQNLSKTIASSTNSSKLNIDTSQAEKGLQRITNHFKQGEKEASSMTKVTVAGFQKTSELIDKINNKSIKKDVTYDYGKEQAQQLKDENKARQDAIRLEKDHTLAIKMRMNEHQAAAIKTNKAMDDEIKKTKNLTEQIELYQKKMRGDMDIFADKNAGKYNKEELEGLQQRMEGLSDSTGDAKRGMKEIDIEFGHMKKSAAGSNSVLSQITENFIKFARFYIVGQAVVSFKNAIQDGVKSVVELDAGLTELAKVTDLSGDALNRFTDRAYEVGRTLGRTGIEVVNASANFARMGFSVENSLRLAEEALLMVNVGDNIGGIDDATSSIISALKGFNVSAEESVEIARTINDMYNEVSNNMAVHTGALAEGVQRSSAVLSQAGVDLDETIGLLTGSFEVLQDMQKSSTGLITITQRLRGMGTDGEAIDGLVPKLEKAFSDIGITLVDTNGQLRDTYSILESLSEVYPTLTKNQQAYIGELVSGKRQAPVLQSLMSNWESVAKATDLATNSAGSAAKENEIFLESIEGRMNKLSSTTEMFFKNLIERDSIKTLIDTLTGLVNILDFLVNNPLTSLITQTVLARTVWVLFQNALNMENAKGVAKMIQGMASALVRFKDGVVMATASTTAFKAALLPFLKFALIIGGITAAIKIFDHFNVTLKEQKEIVETLSSEINNLQSEYDSLKANKERTAEQENYFKLLEKELEIKKGILAIEAENLTEKFFEPNKITGYDDSEAAKAKKQMEELKELREELEGLNEKISAPDYIANEDDTKRIREINGEMLSLETSLIETAKTVQGMSKNLVKASPELDTFARELDKVIYSAEELAERDKWNFAEEVAKQIAEGEKATDGWNKSLMALGFTSEEALSILEGKLNDVKTAYNKVEGSKPSISEEVKSLEKLTEEFEEVTNKLQAYNKILDELNSKEGLSAQSKEDIITKYQEFLPYLDDEQELRKQLINIISDEEETQRQAYTNMIMISEDFFNAKIKGNDTLVKALGDFYTKDLENAKSLADAKKIVEASLIKDLSGLWAKYYNAASSNNLAEADYRKKLAFGYGTAEEKAAMSAAINAIDQQKEVARRFDELAKGFASGVDFSGINLSSNKGSKSSSTKEDYKALADRYAHINQELDKNNVLLAKNKTLQELAKEGSAEQLTLIQEENALYKERQGLLNELNQIRRQEALELEKELSKSGFNFIGSGDDRRISNLENIEGQSKEVEDLVKYYNELRTNLIPQTSQQWWDYQQSIVSNIEKIESTIQSHIDQLKALEDELADFDLSGKIEELNKQLDTAKFNHWIESLILGLERYNDKTELLSFKLSLFDEEDYENRADVIGDLYEASKDKLEDYREEWDRLSAQTPKNANEASQIANAMKQVQQGMREAFVATREYQRQLEQLQFDSISKDFEKANKQLELQLSIIDNNLQSLQDGILPDFSLDMVMPIPDFSDIFDETASENEKLYNEQVDLEKQIQALKEHSLEMQLAEAEQFYEDERKKLIEHYKELTEKIAEKEREILELQEYMDEQQKQLLQQTSSEIQAIVDKDLGTLETSYETSWGNIVETVSNSVAEIKRLVSQANSAIASMGSVSAPSGGGSAGSDSGTTGYTNLNPVVNVNPDGKAPPGLPVGTTVKTGGGDYQITKVNPDGSYESKKVSKYAKGTDGHQGGLALLGDERKGAYEMAILPSGKAVIIGETQSQLVDLPKGTQVIPHDETKDILSHTGNIDGQTIPKYKDGIGTIPKYASGVGIIGSIIGAISGTIASTVSKVTGTSAKLKDTTDKLNKANNKIDRLNNKIDDLSNISYVSNTPTTSETSEFDEIIESIKPDFAVEMSSTFKEGYDKYLEDRIVNLEEIADLQKKYLEGTDEQITQEEILAKIDAQMLEDAKNQSLLKVDLLEQMKDNVAEYTQSLKEQYDDSLASGNTELARQIFEEYNNMLSKSMQIESQIQQAIKQRYEMEFALIEKKLNKQNQIMDELEYQKSLIEILNPDNIIGISDIYKEMADHTSDQITYLYEILNQLSEQQSLLEVGSNEWNIINGQVDNVVSKIRSANLEMAKMAKSAFTGFAGIFKDNVLDMNPAPTSYSAPEDDSDKWLEGLEKQLEIEKLMKYVEENKLELNEKQLSVINNQGKIRKKELDIVRKELELQQLLVKIENLRNQKSIQQLTKKEDGTWDFDYVADIDAINEVEDQILDARLDVIHAEKDLRKELQGESEKAAQDAAKSAQGAYENKIKRFEEVLNNAENRMYKTAEEFRLALASIGLEYAEGWLDEAVDEYWKYFTKTAEIFVKEAFDKTMQALKQQSKAFESIGNESGKSYADGLLDSIDEIMSGDGDIVQKQQAIIDMLASEYSKFALAGNKNGMSFINELISSMETADYQYSANEMSGKIVQAMEERLKELEGTGQDAGKALIEGLLASMEDIANNGEIEDKLLAILALLDKTDEYGTLGQALGDEFMQGLTDTITNITDEVSGEGEGVLSEALNTMITMLDSKIANFAEMGDIQGLAYAEALRVKLQDALENAELTQEDIILLLAEFKDFDLAGLLSGEAYGDSLTEGLIDAEENVDTSSSAIVEGLNEDVENFANAGTAQGEAYKTAITTAFESAIATAKGLIGNLVEYINSQSFSVNIGVSDNVTQPESFDTGGGTGSWDSSGKLAMLHEKEIVLNQSQSKDFNKLVANMPDLLKFLDTDNFSNVLKSAVLSTVNVAIPRLPQIAFAGSGGGDNVFHIAKMEFPNVKDSKAIEDTILNLPLKTKQYVKKN